MALLDRVRERIETDVTDAELQELLTAALAEIEARLGPLGPITVTLDGGRRYLHLTRPADPDQPIAVVEIASPHDGATGRTTIASDDYRILARGRQFDRLADGTNPAMAWAPLVEITYAPVDDQPQRDETAIKLVQLDLTYRGLIKQERAGDYSRQGPADADALMRERDALIASLGPRRGLMMA